MRSLRTPLALLAAAIAVASCLGGDSPTDEGGSATAQVVLQPALIPSPADGSALPVNRIRTRVVREADGVLLREQQFDVSPSATSWAIDVDVPAGDEPTVVVIYLALLNVATDGTESVQFSGRTPPTSVIAGEQLTGVDADLVRGPLSNLSVTAVTIGSFPDTLFVGSSGPLAATVTTFGSQAPETFWTSLDSAVLTLVDSVATGVAPGTGQVVASAGAFADTVDIVVIVPPVDSVRVLPDSADVIVNGTRTYTVQLRDSGGNLLSGRAVFWSTTDTNIATVTQAGVVNAVALGTTRVRAESEGRFDEAVVRVVPVPVRSVLVSPDSAVVQAGSTTTYTAQTRDSIGGVLTGRTIAWTTGNSAIAAVNPNTGLVTGVSAGTTTVRATSEGVFDEATVRVTAATGGGPVNTWLPGSGVWDNPAKWSLGRLPIAGDTVRFTPSTAYVVAMNVDATVARVVIDSGITLDVGDRQLSIDGAATGPDLDVLPGGRLEIRDGTITTTNVRNEGAIEVDGDATILTTSIEQSSLGSILVASDWVLTTNAVDIHSAGAITVESGGALLMGPNTIFTYQGGTISDSGVLFFTPGSELVLQANLSIDGPILFFSDASVTTDFPADRLTIGLSSELEMLGTTGLVEIQPKLVVEGDLFLEGQNVVLYDSLIVATTGTAVIDGSGSNYLFRTEDVVNRGQMYFSGLGLTFGPGSNAGQSVVNESTGQLYFGSGADRYTLNGELTNDGLITVASETVLRRTDVSGVTHETAHHVNSGTIEVVVDGRFQIDLGGSSPTFTNSGTLTLTGVGTFMGVSNLASSGVATIVNDSTGVLNGNGIVDVRTGVPNGVNHGTIAPGLSPGTLTWLGSVPMGPTGRIAIELQGTTPGIGHDQLNASFDHVLNAFGPANGILDVTAPLFTPVDGDRFAVLTFNERQGNFADVNLPTISGVTLDTVWTSNASGPDTLFIEATSGTPAPSYLNRWTGAVDPDWHKPGNWSRDAVPVAGDSVVIDPVGSAVVRITSSTQIGHLKLGGGGGFPTLSFMGTGLSLVVTGTVTNDGYISFDDSQVDDVPMVLAASGGISIGPSGVIYAEGSGDVPQLVGEIANSGSILTAGQPLLIADLPDLAHFNAGLIGAAGGDITILLTGGSSSFTNQGTLLVDAGNTLAFEGGTLTNSSVGSIGGSGTLSVLTTSFANDGAFLPGAGPGVLTVDGDSDWAPTSSLLIEIDGTAPGAYDQLVHTGDVIVDGMLYVSLGAFVPQVGDQFPVMTAQSLSGQFVDLIMPPLAGMALDTVWAVGASTDTLFVVASAASTIALGAVIGVDNTDAQDVDGEGNPVNLVGTASGVGATTLAVGASPPSANFNNLGGTDRTNGFDRSDLLAVRAGRKYDGSPLRLDFDNDGDFNDETPQPGFGMHAARFITFDLAEIRTDAILPSDQGFTLSGFAGPADFLPSTGMSLVVLVDGVPIMVHDVGTGASTSIPFVVPVSGFARYITFVALEGTGLEEYGDHGGFAQVLLTY
jgi:hypothetical protein